MHIQLSPQQEASLLAWAARRAVAEVETGCEPAGYELRFEISTVGSEASARKGPDKLHLGPIRVQIPVEQASATIDPKATSFVEMLKRFNAKERNFLMRYALCSGVRPVLSSTFLSNLLEALKHQGISRLTGSRPVFFGMDYHLEWLHAALLIANGARIDEIHHGVEKARVEDVDLIVVLERTDGSLVLALIEAKGASNFRTKQLSSKLKRLEPIARAISATFGSITPAYILMSPVDSKPSVATLETLSEALEKLGFRSEPTTRYLSGLWMELVGFLSDIDSKSNALRISSCYSDGTRAENLSARENRPYDSWQVVGRF